MNLDTNKLEGKRYVCEKVKGIHNNGFLAESRNVGHLSKRMKLAIDRSERT